MHVLLVTLLVSVALAVIFMAFFIINSLRTRFDSPERDALLPFEEEKVKRAGQQRQHSPYSEDLRY